MEQDLIMLVGQELDNMTHKEYLRKVKTLESAEDMEALENVEKERMKSLEENLDIEWVKIMDSEEFDVELENEYGDLF
jgi:DNA/RNA endonuclease G (NUC1)